MYRYDLKYIAEDLWGSEPIVRKTKVIGIFDANTSRHGGFLVDINLHPRLKKYGSKTCNSNICAFEEDLEALKVLWLYPELINNQKDIDSWLNDEMLKYCDEGKEFLIEFPERKLK